LSPARPIAITTGEPAGVGPELCVHLRAHSRRRPVVLLGDRELLAARASLTGAIDELPDFDPANPDQPVSLLHVPLRVPSQPGRLDVRNAPYVMALLDRAIEGCRAGSFSAMVTAPIQKSVLSTPAAPFAGHTEYLAERCDVEAVVMMLVGGGMRVALATTHLPLSAVPAAITHSGLERSLRILHDDLVTKFGIARPRILVAGLNPHAGEDGHLGREEIEVISPVLEALCAEGFLLQGPLPADTLFQPRYLDHADAVLAMYHDQGLAVLKYASFGQGVNITLGLPIIRTSVDHGTALDLAGTGRADGGSLLAALELAESLVDAASAHP
jgi:4-hydroxythreonine-4-phosphate dehydrogenase